MYCLQFSSGRCSRITNINISSYKSLNPFDPKKSDRVCVSSAVEAKVEGSHLKDVLSGVKVQCKVLSGVKL